MSQDCLFTPLRLGHYQLSNRIVMPPMSSCVIAPFDVLAGAFPPISINLFAP